MPSILKRSLPSIFLSVILALAACVSAPVQEMSDARQAIQAAYAAGADQLASDTFASARSFLEQAEQQLESGHYRDARRNAREAREQAVLAREMAEQEQMAEKFPQGM